MSLLRSFALQLLQKANVFGEALRGGFLQAFDIGTEAAVYVLFLGQKHLIQALGADVMEARGHHSRTPFGIEGLLTLTALIFVHTTYFYEL